MKDFRITDLKKALDEVLAFLDGRDTRKIRPNTLVIKTDDGAKIRFWSTDILTIGKSGVTLDSGGFRTFTTKERMNGVLPTGYGVWQSDNDWYIGTPTGKYAFKDGVSISKSGRVTGAQRATP